MRQIAFSFMSDYKKQFGGELLIGRRKERRPISTKHPLHIVLRSNLAGAFSPCNRSLELLVVAQARKFNIKIYNWSANWTHIHLLVKVQQREDYIKFIRALTAILTLRLRQADKLNGKLFDLRPFTRIVTWGRDFKNAFQYQTLNQLEAHGLIHRKKNQGPKGHHENSPL